MAWHTHIKFQDDHFRNSSNIKGIASTISEVRVLVLLDSRCTPLRLVHGALALAKFQD
jgi:hypothetical protein